MCQTSNLRIASSVDSNPVSSKSLFYSTRNFTHCSALVGTRNNSNCFFKIIASWVDKIISLSQLIQSKLWDTCQKWKFKALKYKFKFGRTDSKWTKYCIIKAFYKSPGVFSFNQWNYFQRGCIDQWQSGDFSIQTLCMLLEAFASKNSRRLAVSQLKRIDNYW